MNKELPTNSQEFKYCPEFTQQFPETGRYTNFSITCKNERSSFSKVLKYDRVLKAFEIQDESMILGDVQAIMNMREEINNDLIALDSESQLTDIIDEIAGNYFDVFKEGGVLNFYTELGVPEANVRQWLSEGAPLVATEMAYEYVRNLNNSI
ncbi:hypothetical protein IB299_22545 [Vibrio parahaemolyticus]|uniref:hypothetical protein n=1 Tax=Vibrio parahaemolyticus TaxID=670 RepID=UPI001B81E164|nr:hypothetical protein [Vibrio parahaemolyticus]EJG1355499.1 hypothetical protein [Vibrio parahaemolyticus]MCC3831818.1 hypothetical protein [Vibrio parahaemolyticus]HBC3510912.1 hypothetical protein [Vibrio parahaemolyticus]HBH7855846.1 hypothetical protein [Vibrio parahaemolyticus]